MRFNLISNLNNGVGLQRNFELFKHQLESRGHTVNGVQFNAKPLVVPPADVNIHDELVTPAAFHAAPVQWAMPHPEWWFHQWDQYHHHWNRVLAKTRDCERIFRAKVGDRCQYIGWTARDLYRDDIRHERKFLHVAGKSSFKNTQAVIEGCRIAGVPLTVIGQHTPSGSLVSESELIRLMNSHFCHVMPSAYEGYGHVLHESQSVGQILITTDVPPMSDITPSFRVPSISTTPHGATALHKVSAMDVARAVRRVLGLTPEEVRVLANQARESYERDCDDFSTALDGLVGPCL